MVPFALLIDLLAELAIYVTLAHHFLDTSWGISAIAAVGAVLGLRAGVVAVTWAFARAYPSPARRLTAAESLRMIVGEYAAFLLIFVVILPFERLWMGRDRMRPCSRPLLLVHGYTCSRGVWWLLRRQLEAAGHTVATVSLAPPYTNIGKLVPQLAQRIENVCQATGADRVVLVAHSMGGLVCRSFLARHGSDRVERLITIASPHSGSELARIGIGKNAREMEPGSLWLKDLAQAGLPVPAVAIRTPHDNFVMPQDNQRLPGAIDVALEGIGHLAVLFTRRTTAELIAACR
ncbi:MAG TPA: alpha/beta fold hydrolase [Azonexus sp.]|nr:alpha/beta fold hydrolase [Azonexus sp.]